MAGWLILIFIAMTLFVGFIIFDKRKFLLEKIKKTLKIKPKVKKEKKEKLNKEKKKEKVSKKKQKTTRCSQRRKTRLWHNGRPR